MTINKYFDFVRYSNTGLVAKPTVQIKLDRQKKEVVEVIKRYQSDDSKKSKSGTLVSNKCGSNVRKSGKIVEFARHWSDSKLQVECLHQLYMCLFFTKTLPPWNSLSLQAKNVIYGITMLNGFNDGTKPYVVHINLSPKNGKKVLFSSSVEDISQNLRQTLMRGLKRPSSGAPIEGTICVELEVAGRRKIRKKVGKGLVLYDRRTKVISFRGEDKREATSPRRKNDGTKIVRPHLHTILSLTDAEAKKSRLKPILQEKFNRDLTGIDDEQVFKNCVVKKIDKVRDIGAATYSTKSINYTKHLGFEEKNIVSVSDDLNKQAKAWYNHLRHLQKQDLFPILPEITGDISFNENDLTETTLGDATLDELGLEDVISKIVLHHTDGERNRGAMKIFRNNEVTESLEYRQMTLNYVRDQLREELKNIKTDTLLHDRFVRNFDPYEDLSKQVNRDRLGWKLDEYRHVLVRSIINYSLFEAIYIAFAQEIIRREKSPCHV
jgi:hypothetical protein